MLLGISKDRAYVEAIENMQDAFGELILAEAESRRSKTDTLIRVLAKYDRELNRFKREYSRIQEQLTEDAKNVLDQYISDIEKKRRSIIREKASLAKRW